MCGSFMVTKVGNLGNLQPFVSSAEKAVGKIIPSMHCRKDYRKIRPARGLGQIGP